MPALRPGGAQRAQAKRCSYSAHGAKIKHRRPVRRDSPRFASRFGAPRASFVRRRWAGCIPRGSRLAVVCMAKRAEPDRVGSCTGLFHLTPMDPQVVALVDRGPGLDRFESRAPGAPVSRRCSELRPPAARVSGAARAERAEPSQCVPDRRGVNISVRVRPRRRQGVQ